MISKAANDALRAILGDDWVLDEPEDIATYSYDGFLPEFTPDAILVPENALSFNRVPGSVTYHDPCDLGRNGGEYDAPRKILNAIPGLNLVEMENIRAKSICCGGGGNLEMTDPVLSGKVAHKKINEIRETGAETVVTACRQCVRSIKGRVRREKLDLEVMDISTVVARAVSNA